MLPRWPGDSGFCRCHRTCDTRTPSPLARSLHTHEHPHPPSGAALFLPNDVIDYPDPPGRTLRLLWIDPATGLAYVYDLRRADALPAALPLAVLEADVQARRARLLLTDPYRAQRIDAPSDKQRRAQLKAWQVVQDLHRHLPGLYERRGRAALVAACRARHGVSAPTVMRYLRRWWQRGQTVDALLPDYANSGAPGRTRSTPAGDGVKRGRPRKGRADGPNVDEALRALFRRAAAEYAARHRRFSRPAAFRRLLADHFAGCDPSSIPTYGQFVYWLARDGRIVHPGPPP